MRRVAILVSDMNAAGGIQRVAANLARDLRPWYDTMVLTIEPLGTPVFRDLDANFQSLNIKRNLKSRRALLGELFAGGRKMRRFVREHNIDTVLAIWYDWASVAAIALPKSVIKIGCEHMSYGEATRTWQLIRSRSYPHLDAVVTLTEEDLPNYQSLSRSASVIPNYVHRIEAAPFEGREKILLSVGHLNLRKGIDRLLLGLKEPLLQHPDWKLVFVGGGEKGHSDSKYLEYVSNLIKLLELNGRVEFHPATVDIDDWYRRASIYVLGSRREGLPMVLIEAKAHGLPVVSFDCPTGPKEIVRNGVDGFLIQNDSIEFGRAAAALMSAPELRRRMSAAAVEDVGNRFSAASVLPKWHELIERLHSQN